MEISFEEDVLSTQENVECVKARLQEEGREARNLIAYSLPLQNRKNTSSSFDKPPKALQPKEIKKPAERRQFKQQKRHRSASAGRDPQASLRARHWGFLFRNLQQAVDEIYQTAEDDESIIECKEAIFMLERYANDFYKLIEWFKIKWEYENTSPPQRPTSLAWEIRTSSPGKTPKSERRSFAMLEARKALNFDHPPSPKVSAVKNKLETCAKSLLRKDCEADSKTAEWKELPLNVCTSSPSAVSSEEDDKALKPLLDDALASCERRISPRDSTVVIPALDSISESPPSASFMGVNTVNESSLSSRKSPQHIPSEPVTSNTLADVTQPSFTAKEDQVSKPTPILFGAENKTSIAEKLEADKVKKRESKRESVSAKSATSPKQCTTVSSTAEDGSKCAQTKVSLKEDIAKLLPEGETKKAADSHLPKNLYPKPGPLVNMNKASQVRKAFNQSRTPIRSPQSTIWRSTTTLPSENKTTCIKQQGAGGRLTLKHLSEGKSTYSPPLGRKTQDGKVFRQRAAPGSRGLERSATSYPLTMNLVRSSTALDGYCGRGQNQKINTSDSFSSFEGKRCPSTSSLASSTNTSSSGLSWADKVKGSTGDRKDSVSEVSLQDEEEGWEIVRRHRKSHGGSNASLSSQGPPSSSGSHIKLQKKGSYPLRMRSRFHHPSSAMSMPSLITELENEASFADLSKQTSKSLQKSLKASGQSNLSFKTPKYSDSPKFNSKQKTKPYRGASNSNGKDSHNSAPNSCSNSPRDKEFSSSGHSSAAESSLISNPDKHMKNEANTKTQNDIRASICPSFSLDEEKEGLCFNNEELSEQKSVSSSLIEEQRDTVAVHQSLTNAEELTKLTDSRAIRGAQLRDIQENSRSEGKEDSGDESEREEQQMRWNAQALECAVQEEKRLKQQIEETERAPIEVGEDIDDEDADEETASQIEVTSETAPVGDSSDGVVKDSYEFESTLTKLSWAEQMDVIERMEAIRPPGRVLHMHEKLSSPSRKLPTSEKLRRHHEKLAKAEKLRGKLIMVKTKKLKDLFRKIDEVNEDKERLLLEKKGLFERKMERAEIKRRSHLQEIVNKAHDEENKAKEIAFINGLEAQNKLHDIMQQHQSHESRLADMAEERSRKQEEKAAKEAAAQARRKAMEAKRQARMLELCEKRRRRCERIDRQQAERREELLEQAREKARDREERLSALQQAQQAKESELVKKIQQKQEETARRHEENIEHIRQKALESSIMKYSRGSDEAPKLWRYETKKLCTLCNSVITSEVYLLSHIRGLPHQEALKKLHNRDVSQEERETYNLKFITNAPDNMNDPQVTREKERQKAMKKRCRKIRTRMTAKGKEYLDGHSPPSSKDTAIKSRLSKALTQIGKLLANQGSGPWPTSDVTLLERHLLELQRVLEKGQTEEQKAFLALDGFRRLFHLLELILTEEQSLCVVPSRSLAFCARAMVSACKKSMENCLFLLFSNLTGTLIDFLTKRLTQLFTEFARSGSTSSINTAASLPSDPATAALMELAAAILQTIQLTNISNTEGDNEDIWPRIQDIVSYCVSMGVADKIAWYFNHVQNPVENDPPSAEIILASMSLLSALAGNLSGRSQLDDPTQLIGTFRVMDACGVVSLLYGLLLHQGGRSPTPPASSHLSPSTLAISAAATTFLHSLAELDLNMFQAILGSEGISLEFRHIASFLLWYCSHWPCEEVLLNVIALVGYFAVSNKENQSIIQSGETPSVLQQLCSLPWQYFSEPYLMGVLFPTLLACCLHNDDNLNILQQEMSFQVLEEYLVAHQTPKKPLLQLLHKLNNAKNTSKCV